MLKDSQKKAFVILTRFCPLSNPPPTHLFLTDNIRLDVIPIANETYTVALHCNTIFQVLKLLLMKSYKMQEPVLPFLVVLHQQTPFLQVFRTSFNITWKNSFHHKLSIFIWFTQPTPHRLPSPKWPKPAKHDKNVFVNAP